MATETFPLVIFVSGKNVDEVTGKLNIVKAMKVLNSNAEKFREPACFDDPVRGVCIVQQGIVVFEEIQVLLSKRPVWFLINSIGSQWPRMVRVLKDVPVYSQAVEECSKILRKADYDLEARINFTESISSFAADLDIIVMITVVQLALIDVLKAINVEPDYFLGYSLGEHVCCYLNGTASKLQVLFSIFWRYQFMAKRGKMCSTLALFDLPATIELPRRLSICSYASEFEQFIGGPWPDMARFMEHYRPVTIVTKKGAVHHNSDCAPFNRDVHSLLKDIIGDGEVDNSLIRSEKWVSTSFHDEELDQRVTQYADCDYLMEVAIRPVFYTQAVKKINKDALIIEIGPSPWLKPFTEEYVGPFSKYVNLMDKDADEPEAKLTVCKAFATIFLEGHNVNLRKLYEF